MRRMPTFKQCVRAIERAEDHPAAIGAFCTLCGAVGVYGLGWLWGWW